MTAENPNVDDCLISELQSPPIGYGLSAEIAHYAPLVASGAILANHYPGHGFRHKAVLALAGWFAKGGVDHDSARQIIAELVRETGDDEIDDRIAAVDSTYRNHKAGEPVIGIALVSELFPPAAVEEVARLLHLPRPHQSVERADDPHRLARLVLRDRFSAYEYDRPIDTLRHYCGSFHQWVGHAWRVVEPDELDAILGSCVKNEFDRVSVSAQKRGDRKGVVARPVIRSLIDNVRLALLSETHLPSMVKQPSWLGLPPAWPATEMLAVQNGLVHLPSLIAGKEFLLPHTPRFFSPMALDYPVTTSAPVPESWIRFLSQLWPSDPRSIETLQEFFGYVLTPDTSQQKIFVIIGPKRSGKGTIARVLTAVIGPENVAGPTLESLATEFGLQPLIGKPLAIFSDARLDGRANSSVITERLLSISGEDRLTINKKYRDPVTLALPTRLLILSNEVPRLLDASGALGSRMVILQLVDSFYGREDKGLTTKLLAERPGILLWSIQGWKRLRERGYFEEPLSATGLRGDLEELSSPVLAFIKERCDVGPLLQISRGELHRAYVKWCEKQGRTYIEPENIFGRNLRAALPALGDSQPRINGERVRVYTGIALKS
jgi:putative DNA primase/helicase